METGLRLQAIRVVLEGMERSKALKARSGELARQHTVGDRRWLRCIAQRSGAEECRLFPEVTGCPIKLIFELKPVDMFNPEG